MTLILTAMTPEVVWQSADNLVSLKGKPHYSDAVKHVTLTCPDGSALVAFVGLAELPDGTRMGDWIRTTLRGANRLIEQDILHLTEMASNEIGSSIYGGHALAFTVVAVRGSELWYYEITNASVYGPDWASRPARRNFNVAGYHVLEARVGAVGSGLSSIEPEDMRLIEHVLAVNPQNPQDMRYLLAAANRRAARRKISGISATCSTAVMGVALNGAAIETHDSPRVRRGIPSRLRTPFVIPHIYYGIDLTETTRVMQEQAIRLTTSSSTPMTDQELADALERARRDSEVPRHVSSLRRAT